jgi:multiple sugar transport system permease protein
MKAQSSLITGLLWTSPWWLGFLFLLALPMGYSLYISFCDYSLLQPAVFIGPENYVNLWGDPDFRRVVRNTLLFAAVCVPATTLLAIALAVMLNQRVLGLAFFRACIFVPSIVPLVTAGVVWMWMLNPEYGLVNQGLALVGIPHDWRPNWLESAAWAMPSLILVSLWFAGAPMVIYLAGLQEIPIELYEASRLDGASRVRQLWHVTLPGLSPVILFNVIVGIITSLQVFALPFVMWRMRPGPGGMAHYYTTYLYQNAFQYLKMGYASAMAWIQLIIVLLLTGLVFWASRKTIYYRGA